MQTDPHAATPNPVDKPDSEVEVDSDCDTDLAPKPCNQLALSAVSYPQIPTAAVSSIAEEIREGYQRISLAYLTLERVVGWIVWLIMAGVAVVASLFVWLAGTPPEVVLGLVVAAGLCLCMLAWWVHTFPLWQYQASGWRLDKTGLLIRRGVFWRKVVAVPRARVQHADVHQGPLMRHYGLAHLIIYTAGTENAALELPGLERSIAESLRDALIEDRDLNDAV